MSFIKFGLAIYELIDEQHIIFKGRKIKVDPKKMNYPKSDTLKDLFDEVIMVKQDEKPHQLRDYDDLSEVKDRTVYGAIWIEMKLSNGKKIYRLEPVAILNEHGSFELLNLR